MKVVVLDDYQRCASPVRAVGRARLPRSPSSTSTCSATRWSSALAGADVVVAMRERTPFPRRAARAAAGPAAAGHHRCVATRRSTWPRRAGAGVTVCGTGSLPGPAAELTWALILALLAPRRRRPTPLRDGRLAAHRRHRPRRRDARRCSASAGSARGSRRVGAGVRDGRARLEPEPRPPSAPRDARRRRRSAKDELLAALRRRHAPPAAQRPRPAASSARAELARDEADAPTWSTPRAARSSTRPRWSPRCTTARSPAPASTSSTRSRCPPTTRCARAPRTVLTPHLGYVTDGGYRLFYGDAVEDIAAWLDGAPLRVVTAG